MINIIPINDTEPHQHDTECSCNPIIEVKNDEIIAIHNSFDNREVIERLVEGLNIKTTTGWKIIQTT